MEDMPVVEWNKYFVEGLSNPKKTQEFMWKAAPFLEARYQRGYSEDIQRALSEGKKLGAKKKIDGWLTSLVRMGDIGAIIYGGYPVIKYLTSKEGGNLSLQEAVDQFEKRTLRSQQSGLTSSLSVTQSRRNPFINFFFAFKNTPTQYLRKMSDAMISYYNGDISEAQFIKTMGIYAIIQPAMFGLATQMMRALLYDDEDDYLDDVVSNISHVHTSLFNVLFVNTFSISLHFSLHYISKLFFSFS